MLRDASQRRDAPAFRRAFARTDEIARIRLLRIETKSRSPRPAEDGRRPASEAARRKGREKERKRVALIYVKVIPFLYYSGTLSRESPREGLRESARPGGRERSRRARPSGNSRREDENMRQRGGGLREVAHFRAQKETGWSRARRGEGARDARGRGGGGGGKTKARLKERREVET